MDRHRTYRYFVLTISMLTLLTGNRVVCTFNLASQTCPQVKVVLQRLCTSIASCKGRCGHSTTVGSYSTTDSLISTLEHGKHYICSCDFRCTLYEDCCADFLYECQQEHERLSFSPLGRLDSSKFLCVDGFKVIAECPDLSSHSVEVRATQQTGFRQERVVITDLADGMSYINQSVFQCNNNNYNNDFYDDNHQSRQQTKIWNKLYTGVVAEALFTQISSYVSGGKSENWFLQSLSNLLPTGLAQRHCDIPAMIQCPDNMNGCTFNTADLNNECSSYLNITNNDTDSNCRLRFVNVNKDIPRGRFVEISMGETKTAKMPYFFNVDWNTVKCKHHHSKQECDLEYSCTKSAFYVDGACVQPSSILLNATSLRRDAASYYNIRVLSMQLQAKKFIHFTELFTHTVLRSKKGVATAYTYLYMTNPYIKKRNTGISRFADPFTFEIEKVLAYAKFQENWEGAVSVCYEFVPAAPIGLLPMLELIKRNAPLPVTCKNIDMADIYNVTKYERLKDIGNSHGLSSAELSMRLTHIVTVVVCNLMLMC